MQKKALGKGLNALIPDLVVGQGSAEADAGPQPSGPKYQEGVGRGLELIPIDQIEANQDQPRKGFSPEGIDELAASIKEKGILQPVIVTRQGDREFKLICGERRVHAARLCGLNEVPAVIKEAAPEDFLECALVENIQREDLNPLEEAEAYRRLCEERGLTQDEVAKRVGKDRTTVSNMIRLLRLPGEVLELIADTLISTGHARCLLGLPSPEHQRQMARRIADENLSVRQTETLVNRAAGRKRSARKARHLTPEVLDLERRLEHHFGTEVRIFPSKNQDKGRIQIHYFSLSDLDRFLEISNVPTK